MKISNSQNLMHKVVSEAKVGEYYYDSNLQINGSCIFCRITCINKLGDSYEFITQVSTIVSGMKTFYTSYYLLYQNDKKIFATGDLNEN